MILYYIGFMQGCNDPLEVRDIMSKVKRALYLAWGGLALTSEYLDLSPSSCKHSSSQRGKVSKTLKP